MARIRHTKTELKSQRQALDRYERFLPMLQLKKQQLQLEVRSVDRRLDENADRVRKVLEGLEPWIGLFAEDAGVEHAIGVAGVKTSSGNIAGVVFPVLDGIDFRRQQPDLFATPPWIDHALEALEQLARLDIEAMFLREQKRCLSEELSLTSQRVNLFEKVKIPECRENIRTIKIFLGDLQTAAVVRAKLAKDRTVCFEYDGEAA